jgi:ATP-dependent RNA helicase DDX46/PRP5
MVATSVCARGLDIKHLILVVNFKCPDHLEDYIHRIGRTGRAGNKGTAITFITPEEDQYASILMKALESSKAEVPEELIHLNQNWKEKVKRGEVKDYYTDYLR